MNQYRSVAVVITHSDIVDNQMYSQTSAHREDFISPLSFRSTPGAADAHFWVEPTICRPIYKAGLILFCFFFFGQLVVRAPQVRGMDWVDPESEPRVQGHFMLQTSSSKLSLLYTISIDCCCACSSLWLSGSYNTQIMMGSSGYMIT